LNPFATTARSGQLQKSIGILALWALLSACSDRQEDAATVTLAEPGPIPAYEQRSGDPARGYDVLVNGGYITCGIPYAAWRRLNPDVDAGPGMPGRDSRNESLPYFLSLYTDERGVDLVTTNCLLCHGAEFEGELVVGLGNEFLDFTQDPRASVDAIGSYVTGEDETAAWKKWGSRIEAIAPYMITDTLGVNPAPNLTLALIAHRDVETLAWSDEPLLEPPPQRPLPVSVPPWWRMAKKHAMFYNGMARGDHARYMMMKSLVCADDTRDVEVLDAMFADIRAFIASLQAPEFPFPIDAALAAEGERVFNRSCAACHGTYGAEPDYPNLLVDLDTVGTDPAYALQAYEDGQRFMQWFNASWYGERATARPGRGYVAPPLDGVWATAPFLHNGSVPSIAALLDSSKRPQYWQRNFDSPEYDARNLGWVYRELDSGKAGAAGPAERASVYDTTLEGYSNQGHVFGDTLTEDERNAVIEYLKSL
jgi:mono/diheme cytochrome c family protein